MGDQLKLRPVEEADLSNLVRLFWDPAASGEYQWFGFRMADVRQVERRWQEDGLIGKERSFLAVELENGTCAGWVVWRTKGHFDNCEIGIALFPAHRGRGIGTEAQRQLVSYLFRTTTVYRLEAATEVDNLAEQRALEKVGFRREGVMRGHYFRDGSWRDSVVYGLLREDER
jgi:[ribosomal protein S5]-alanine N-acetyltransferase